MRSVPAQAEAPHFHGALVLPLLLLAAPALAQEGYAIHLEMDGEAAGYLAAVGEQVVVRAAYFGAPRSQGATLDEAGQVALGDEAAVVAPESQDVPLGSALDQLPLGTVAGPMVSLTAVSAAMAFPDNMLDCTPVEAPLAEVQAGAVVIACKVLGM